jgi:hypothetical protein
MISIWMSRLSTLLSIPFNLISISDSLGFIDIGVYSLYSLAIGVTLAVTPYVVRMIVKRVAS